MGAGMCWGRRECNAIGGLVRQLVCEVIAPHIDLGCLSIPNVPAQGRRLAPFCFHCVGGGGCISGVQSGATNQRVGFPGLNMDA